MTRYQDVFENARIFDLTHPLSPRTPRSSDHPEVHFQTLRWFSRHGLQTRQITASLHSGTHIDAPSLFVQGGWDVDDVPVEQMVGTGVILDIPRDEWGEITAADLQAAQPEIEPGDIVVICTGWHKYYESDEEKYVLQSPGLTKDAVDYLVERNIKFLGFDGPSSEHIFMRVHQWKQLRPDLFGDVEPDPTKFPPGSYGHKAMFAHNIVHVDNVGGQVAEVAGMRAFIFAPPAKYKGVEGAPVRMLAVVPKLA